MDFFAIRFVVDICAVVHWITFLLTSMESMFIPTATPCICNLMI